ncbi:hypothetical protein [Amycolatopsis taiwanensis]|uniref:ATP/GTP-binding protein n=1 Tax=Amycolatopsis taiwanensis TaxID=342230 RepID=A0A9W6VER2_9PSEU|nr:hypothetical protein [Amycolatopsis taiwanensis]GLY68753.1 ATP/GTP-binding protein [Amycolatopsis taiwanensis]
MLTVRRLGTVAVFASVAVLASVALALAGDWYGDVDCGQTPYAGCELGAGQHGHDAPAPRPGPPPGTPKSQAGGHGTAPAPPGDRVVGGDAGQANCSYVRSDYQPPSNGVQTASYSRGPSGSGGIQFVSLTRSRPERVVLAQGPGRGGAWYVYRCSGQGRRDALYRAPVWIPEGQEPRAAPLPSPEQLAEQARSQLRLPNPVIASSPAGTQLVRLPTWLWLDRAMWQPQSATASVPAVSVTATATPTSVTWSMGDGSTVTCIGPGTPFPAHGDPQVASPDCGYTYQRSSAAAPGERFPATATVSWRITWSGAGASGTFPDMTTSASASFRVAEVQALGTG